MTPTNIFFSILIIFNFFVLFHDNITQPGARSVYLSSLVILTITIPLLFYIIKKKLKVIAWNAAIISFFLLVINLLFFVKIIEIPGLVTWVFSNKDNLKVVEFMENSPFLKFKPNSQIESQGARGKDFTYRWMTDEYGFKNMKLISDNNEPDYIAVGNSFTEAMGTSVENTWTSQILKNSSISIYNTGVQGYAASQFLGAYNFIIKEKNPKYGIIIGAFPTIYKREAKFAVKDLKIKQGGTGGIASILGYDNVTRLSFLVGFIKASKKYFYAIKKSKINDPNLMYVSEIPKKFLNQEKLINDKNWERYIDALTILSNKVLSENKRVILLQFPRRHEIYFKEKDLGINDFNQIQYYTELSLLKSSLPPEVEILDMFPFLKSKYNKYKKNLYFKKDGHMNEFGNRLVAEFLLNYLSKNIENK